MARQLSNMILLGVFLIFVQYNCVSSFDCPTDRGYFAHETLCDSFYVCYQNKPYLNVCPEHQLFDYETLQCTDEYEVDCGLRSRPGVTELEQNYSTFAPDEPDPQTEWSTVTDRQTPNPNPSHSTSSKPTTIDDSSEEEVECPEADGLFPHPTDIHKYLHCQGYYPHIMQCPHNLVFDPNLKVCSWS